MRALLSAYACEPGKGSEAGVGWHWAVELASLGHQIEVLTRANNRAPIEAALGREPISGLRFHYYDLPRWIVTLKSGRRFYHLYYSLWQRGAFRMACKLVETQKYDLVHHLTFGTIRQPSLMGGLGLPFVVGPLGGGESIPPGLRSSFPRRRRFTESVRETINRLSDFNPSIQAMYRQAALIFCRTEETRSFVPADCHPKTRLQMEIGIDPRLLVAAPEPKHDSSNFLYAGALLYWKGVHLALEALALLRQRRPQATLDIIGDGEDERWLKRHASSLGLDGAVRWLGKLPQHRLWEQYARHSAFVFPSMHDSGGTVVLEALSQALPVICLDTGGPGAILPPSCGIKVPVRDRTHAQVVRDLAGAMQIYIDNPESREKTAGQTLEAARSHFWSHTVSAAYSLVEQTLRSPVQA